jgi:uncharacterized DUF497 family protein
MIPIRYNIYTMGFEYDLNKSESTNRKYRIDFIEAQRLWNDPDLLEIPAENMDELRFLVIGEIQANAGQE